MKQTYVTALLLWLMLAGVCRGQGKNRLRVVVAPQIAWDVYPLLKRQLGVGAGIYGSRQFSSKIGVKTGLIAMVQKKQAVCNDSTFIYNGPGVSYPDTIWICTNSTQKQFWHLQIPLMAYYSPNLQARLPLLLGIGMQANVLLGSINQQSKFFRYKQLSWAIPLSIGTYVKLPNNKRLRPEIQGHIFTNKDKPFFDTYSFQLGFEF